MAETQQQYHHTYPPKRFVYNRLRTNPKNGNVAARNQVLPSVSHPQTSSKPSFSHYSCSRRQETKIETLCKYWASGNCKYGDKCRFLHSWCDVSDNGFSMITRLYGHKKSVSGIQVPIGSDKLYTTASDGMLRVWNCNSGNTTNLFNLGTEIGSLLIQGCWIFLGLTNLVKVWRVEADICDRQEFCLDGPSGQVYAIIAHNDMLFAGAQDGKILVWRCKSEGNCATINSYVFELVTSLEGHTRGVVSLIMERSRLISGSLDGTIKFWDIQKMECLETLKGHSDGVMSLFWWGQYLFSCSLDQTVHVWGVAPEGGLEIVHTHKEGAGILALFGMVDAENKPILYCSCNDNTVRLYEMPSFAERGKIFAQREVRKIQQGPGGLFFTADATGVVTVWRWLKKQSEEATTMSEMATV